MGLVYVNKNKNNTHNKQTTKTDTFTNSNTFWIIAQYTYKYKRSKLRKLAPSTKNPNLICTYLYNNTYITIYIVHNVAMSKRNATATLIHECRSRLQFSYFRPHMVNSYWSVVLIGISPPRPRGHANGLTTY